MVIQPCRQKSTQCPKREWPVNCLDITTSSFSNAAMVATVSHIVEVDPRHGNDQQALRSSTPFRTLTAALASVNRSALVRLAPGIYSVSTGEKFPLVIPETVILQGHEASQGKDIVISGGAKTTSIEENQSTALILSGKGQLRGITVQNPAGIGILITSGNPLVRACRIQQCAHNGLKVLAQARPSLLYLEVHDVAGTGIGLTQQARGDIQDTTLRRCQYGIAITQTASPLVQNNQCLDNQVGVLVTDTARPVLRQNLLLQNKLFGLWVQGQGQPDIGQPTDNGGNIIRHNRQADIRNDTRHVLLSVGNDLLPQKLQGTVRLGASIIPDRAAVPPALLSHDFGQDELNGSPILPSTSPANDPGSVQPVIITDTHQPSSPFVDLQGHWATPFIEALATRDLLRGYPDGTFRPNAVINRAQFATLVANSYQHISLTRPGIQFKDVATDFWGYRAIAKAQQQGFIRGYPDHTFRPNQPMSRVQAIAAVASGLGLSPAPASLLGSYRDRAQIPSYAIEPLATATQHHLVINYPDPQLLRPLEPMTRAEVAVLIYQGLVATGQAPAVIWPGLNSSGPVRADSLQGSFADINQHWGAKYIQELLQRGLVQGYDDGNFHPDHPMTRAQMAALLARTFQPAPQRPAQPFKDVPPGHWAASAIERVYQGGFLSGFPDHTFAPDHSLLKVEAWVSLVRGLQLLADQPANPTWLQPFKDRQQVPTYAVDAVAKAARMGLIVDQPEPHYLRPNRVASRADICAAVAQTLNLKIGNYQAVDLFAPENMRE
jgi:parallel beta-helix repeat protein